MLMSALGIIVERNVFCLLFKLELSGGGQTLGEGGLAVKLMRKSPRFQHGLRVNAGRLRKSCVHRERRRSGLLARLTRIPRACTGWCCRWSESETRLNGTPPPFSTRL